MCKPYAAPRTGNGGTSTQHMSLSGSVRTRHQGLSVPGQRAIAGEDCVPQVTQ
jgi:hypothetical protein